MVRAILAAFSGLARNFRAPRLQAYGTIQQVTARQEADDLAVAGVPGLAGGTCVLPRSVPTYTVHDHVILLFDGRVVEWTACKALPKQGTVQVTYTEAPDGTITVRNVR